VETATIMHEWEELPTVKQIGSEANLKNGEPLQGRTGSGVMEKKSVVVNQG
jgi:hypothetical protein